MRLHHPPQRRKPARVEEPRGDAVGGNHQVFDQRLRAVLALRLHVAQGVAIEDVLDLDGLEVERTEALLHEIASGHGAALSEHAASTLAAGGKRLRPVLVFVCAGSAESDNLVRAGASVELLHMATLVHDAILTVGFFAITQIDFNLSSIAAILTIIGYSLNDTVVIFDRVREILRKYKQMSVRDIIDLATNQTLARTIMTSLTASFSSPPV